MKRLTVVCSIFLLCLGCSRSIPTPSVEIINRSPLVLPDPAPLNLSPVQFKVIETDTGTYVGLTIEDYKRLAENVSKIQSYIRLQKIVIEAYRKYYQPKD